MFHKTLSNIWFKKYIIYNQAYNLSFPQKLESIQYNNAVLDLIGAIRDSAREKLYQGLGLASP